MKRSTKDPAWVGKPVVDANGQPVGRVQSVVEGEDGWPRFALVDRGLASDTGAETVVTPVERATLGRRELRLPYTARTVEAGPTLGPDERKLDDELASRALGHFEGRRPEGASLADAPDAMVVHEEEATTAVETVAAHRAVARKVVLEEERTITVRLRREDVRVERVPLEDAQREPLAERKARRFFEEHDEGAAEWVLYGEEPVVLTQVVPVERVRLAKEVVTEEERVAVDLAREQVQVEVEPAGADAQPAVHADDDVPVVERRG